MSRFYRGGCIGVMAVGEQMLCSAVDILTSLFLLCIQALLALEINALGTSMFRRMC